MAVLHLPDHISHQFDKELEDVRSQVLAMGGVLEDHLLKVLGALSRGNVPMAEEVVGSGYKLDRYEDEIEEACTAILLRRQPAAIDLRLVLAVSKIIADLERAGNETERVAAMVVNVSSVANPKSYYLNVLNIGHSVRRMMNGALDAFARMDSGRALGTIQQIPDIERETDAIMRQLITYMMEDPRMISRVLDVVLAARSLARVGDHAANICENLIYVVEGRQARLSDAQSPQSTP